MQHNEQTEQYALLYAYGELDTAREQAFTEHLKTCAVCQKIIFTASLTTAALPEIKAPQGLIIPSEVLVKKPFFVMPFFTFRRLVPVGALALIVALAGIMIYKLENSTRHHYTNSVENMYSQVSTIESEVNNILKDIENM